MLGAFEHSGVPFHRVVEALNVERDASRTPVFQAMFTLQDGIEENDEDGLADDDSKRKGTVAKFELTLFTVYSSRSGGLVGALAYNVDLFDEVTA